MSDYLTAVSAFEIKLKLFQIQLKKKCFHNFERLKSLIEIKWSLKNVDKFIVCIDNLLDEFKSRFSDFKKHKTLFTLSSNPWLIEPEKLVDMAFV